VSGPGLPSERSERGELSIAPSPAAREGATAAPAVGLDNYATSRPRRPWDRRQRRIFHRVNTCLTYWEANGHQVAWLNLTTAVGGDAPALARHFRTLLRRIERKFGYTGMEYFVVRTAEGNGVLHALLAWKGPREFWIPHSWLKRCWLEIHGAGVLVIKRYGGGGGGRLRVSRYIVSQYVGGQVGIVRAFWSWKRTFGMPIVKVWRMFRLAYGHRGIRSVVELWSVFLRGGAVPVPYRGRVRGKGEFHLESMRGRDIYDLVSKQMRFAYGA
jgi:hypothetical protein